MKVKSFSSLLFYCLLLSCTKESEFTITLDENTSIENTLLLKYGIFTPTSGMTVSGIAELRKGGNEHFVRLVNFNISSGPDLKVYLSKSDTPNAFVNLGAVENNKNVYTIPAGVLLAEYSYVLIHCQQYNHLFAFAKLN